MSKILRNLTVLVLPLVLLALWLVFSSNEFSQQAGAETADGSRSVQEHLDQAANSIIAAAKESVANAESDEEAINQAHLSLEALRVIGMLGSGSADDQTARLLDALQTSDRPAVAEAVVQLRLGMKLRNWNQLTTSEREAAVNRFVEDVKKTGLTEAHADLVMKLGDMLERSGQGELAASAIEQLLPLFNQSDELQTRASLLEGFVRRMPGQPMELEGTLLDGSELDWDALRGKVVLVDFFASWCGPCRAEVPNILANHKRYQDKGFTIVGVNMDTNRAAAEKYVQEAGLEFPVLFSDDPEATGWDHPMGRKYGVTALPRVILVDKDGTIVHTEARGERLGQLLEELLGPPSAPSTTETTDVDAPSAPSEEPDSGVVPAGFEEEAAPQIEEG